MNRRQFLRGAVVLAPAVILTPGLLMPVRKLAQPAGLMAGEWGRYEGFNFIEASGSGLTIEKLRRARDILLANEVMPYDFILDARMNDWRTCPSCGKPHALIFSPGAVKGERVITCRFCPHREVSAPPKPKA